MKVVLFSDLQYITLLLLQSQLSIFTSACFLCNIHSRISSTKVQRYVVLCKKLQKLSFFLFYIFFIWLVYFLNHVSVDAVQANSRDCLCLGFLTSWTCLLEKWLKAAGTEEKEEVKNRSALESCLRNCQSAVRRATSGSSRFVPPCCCRTPLLSQTWSPRVHSNTWGPLCCTQFQLLSQPWWRHKWLYFYSPVIYLFIFFISPSCILQVVHLDYTVNTRYSAQTSLILLETFNCPTEWFSPKYPPPVLHWTHLLNIKMQPGHVELILKQILRAKILLMQRFSYLFLSYSETGTNC